MKLKEWAEKTGVKYLTAYRWFKDGTLPVKAYQTDSGTIIVEDENMDSEMISSASNDAMSLFLKKTVEFSKNNSSVEDFAAFIISNFKLKLNSADSPKYSKNKPKTEEIQKHFQKFLPDQKNVEHLKNIKSLLKEGKSAGEVLPADLAINSLNEILDTNYFIKTNSDTHTDVCAYEQNISENLVPTTVDFNSTPQQINYTGSTSQVFGYSDPLDSNSTVTSINYTATSNIPAVNLNTPLTKEAPRKRGRKPTKKV